MYFIICIVDILTNVWFFWVISTFERLLEEAYERAEMLDLRDSEFENGKTRKKEKRKEKNERDLDDITIVTIGGFNVQGTRKVRNDLGVDENTNFSGTSVFDLDE